jgi:hypothetical protein
MTTSASAQSPASTPAPQDASPSSVRERVELSVLGGIFTGADLGDTRATMLTNEVPTSGETALFTTSTSIGAAPLVEGRVGVRLSRAWSVEAGLSYARPELSVDITGDVEGVPALTATSALTQLIVDGAVQYRWQGRRVTPLVMGGGGYLRQLDGPRTTTESGAVFYGGGGVRVALAPASRGFARRLALRGDARVVWLRDGITLNEDRGPALSVSGGLSIGL